MRIYQNRYEKMINDIKVGKIFKSGSFIYFVTKEFWNSNPSSKIFKHMVPQIENNSRIGRLAIKYCILSLSEVTKYVVNRHLVPNHIRYVVRGASKVIYTKYSKHWLYTVAHTIECVCSKMNNSWFNPWFSFYISSLCPAPYIEWYIC